MIFPTGKDSNEPLPNYRHRVANGLSSAQALESPKTEGGTFASGTANYIRVGVIHFNSF